MKRSKTDELNDDEYVAFILTQLFHIINPGIDEGACYPVVLDMLHDGLAEDNVLEYGARIRATMSADGSKVH